MNLLFLLGAEMWDFLLMLSHLECPISGSQPPWPAVLGPYVCDQKLPGTMGSSGRREVMTYVFSLESSFSLCHGCGQFPVHWWRSYLTYPDPWPLLWHQLFCLQGIFAVVINLRSELWGGVPVVRNPKPKAWRMSSEAGSSIYNIHFLSDSFLSTWYRLWLWGLIFLLSYITCVRPWVQHGDN